MGKKTAVVTLALAVNYDPEATTPEALSKSLNMVLGTLTLDDQGRPALGTVEPLDAAVENFAPDMDVIHVTIGDIRIVVERNENGETEITVHNTEEGTHLDLVLGQEGETQRV